MAVYCSYDRETMEIIVRNTRQNNTVDQPEVRFLPDEWLAFLRRIEEDDEFSFLYQSKTIGGRVETRSAPILNDQAEE